MMTNIGMGGQTQMPMQQNMMQQNMMQPQQAMTMGMQPLQPPQQQNMMQPQQAMMAQPVQQPQLAPAPAAAPVPAPAPAPAGPVNLDQIPGLDDFDSGGGVNKGVSGQ